MRRVLAAGMPPHVTLLYPFVDDALLTPALVEGVAVAVAGVPAFEYAFAEVGRFDNLPNESYAWLAPTPAEGFRSLIERLAAAFPQHPPYGGAFDAIVPHLTIATSTDAGVLRRAEERAAARLPISGRAAAVELLRRGRRGWRRQATMPLAPSVDSAA